MKNTNCKGYIFFAISSVIYTLTLISSSTMALEISPLTVELKIDSKPNYQQIIVRNTSNISVPVEIGVNEIIFNPENVKPLFSLTPIEDINDLLVFPPALILEAGEAKAIRVQWNGPKIIPQSKSYFIRFSQLQLSQPLSVSPEESGVKIFVHFNVVVHISSMQLKENLSVLADTLTINKQQQKLTVNIQNNGDNYYYLKPNKLIKLNIFNKKQSALDESISSTLSDIFFPPHSIRNITIPVNSNWIEGDSLIINTEKI
ncbi:MAG: P pilus assembly chaperone PapD [Cognaticolwellia sp.]|jgi:P pilus assembly chaperone PapD